MKLKQKIPQPKFGETPGDPFAGDLLGRGQEIKALTPMIQTASSPAVMALDAEWGAGKTAFIKMWAAYLNQEGIPALYFNAWETDFAADPLVPFVETITAEMTDKRQELMESAKTLSLAIGDVVGRAAGAGVLVDAAQKAAKHFFAPCSELKKFKGALGKFIKSQKGKRVVIFVDELDRCRPDYAVKVLERIKHLFEVPGVIFVLAANREQLCQSVKTLYGLCDKSANTYLRRFIEADFTINSPDMSEFIKMRIKQMGIKEHLNDRRVKNQAISFSWENKPELLHEQLALLAKVYRYSLRDAEQLLMRIVFVLRTLQDGSHRFHPMLLAFLVMARQQMPDAYGKYIRADNGDEMAKLWERDLKAAGIGGLKLGEILGETHGHDGLKKAIADAARITAHILMAKYFAIENTHGTPSRSALIEKHKEIEMATRDGQDGAYNHSLYSAVKIMCNHPDNTIDLQRIVKKIEMLDRFHFLDGDDAEGEGD